MAWSAISSVGGPLLVVRAYLRPVPFLGPPAVALALVAPSTGLAADALVPAGASGARPAATPHFEVTRLKDAGECPDEEDLQSAASRALEVAPPGLPDKRIARTRFDVQFSRGGSGYTAILRSKELNSERTLTAQGDACDPLADAVAIAVAVLLGTIRDAPPRRSTPAPASRSEPASSSLPVPTTDDSTSDEFSRDSGGEDAERKAKNVISAEFMGSGIGDSINYERFLDNGVASIRIGVGYTQQAHLPAQGHQLTFPLLLQLDSSETGSHNFHFAGGVTAVFRDGPLDEGIANPQNTGFGSGYDRAGAACLGNIVLGYRYLPRTAGLTVGVYGMVLFNFIWGTLWTGANMGYAF